MPRTSVRFFFFSNTTQLVFEKPEVSTNHARTPVYFGDECQAEKGTRQSRTAEDACTEHDRTNTKSHRMPSVRGYTMTRLMSKRSPKSADFVTARFSLVGFSYIVTSKTVVGVRRCCRSLQAAVLHVDPTPRQLQLRVGQRRRQTGVWSHASPFCCRRRV